MRRSYLQPTVHPLSFSLSLTSSRPLAVFSFLYLHLIRHSGELDFVRVSWNRPDMHDLTFGSGMPASLVPAFTAAPSIRLTCPSQSYPSLFIRFVTQSNTFPYPLLAQFGGWCIFAHFTHPCSRLLVLAILPGACSLDSLYGQPLLSDPSPYPHTVPVS